MKRKAKRLPRKDQVCRHCGHVHNCQDVIDREFRKRQLEEHRAEKAKRARWHAEEVGKWEAERQAKERQKRQQHLAREGHLRRLRAICLLVMSNGGSVDDVVLAAGLMTLGETAPPAELEAKLEAARADVRLVDLEIARDIEVAWFWGFQLDHDVQLDEKNWNADLDWWRAGPPEYTCAMPERR